MSKAANYNRSHLPLLPSQSGLWLGENGADEGMG